MKTWTIIPLVILLSGCTGIPLPKITTPKKPETVYRYNERISKNPTAVVTNGKVVVVEESERVIDIGLEQTPKKLSFMQRLGNWISGIGILGLIVLIAFLFLAPGATIGFLLGLYRKWKKAFRETVIAIKNSKITETDQGLKIELGKKQSNTTKKLVDNIKREN